MVCVHFEKVIDGELMYEPISFWLEIESTFYHDLHPKLNHREISPTCLQKELQVHDVLTLLIPTYIFDRVSHYLNVKVRK